MPKYYIPKSKQTKEILDKIRNLDGKKGKPKVIKYRIILPAGDIEIEVDKEIKELKEFAV